MSQRKKKWPLSGGRLKAGPGKYRRSFDFEVCRAGGGPIQWILLSECGSFRSVQRYPKPKAKQIASVHLPVPAFSHTSSTVSLRFRNFWRIRPRQSICGRAQGVMAMLGGVFVIEVFCDDERLQSSPCYWGKWMNSRFPSLSCRGLTNGDSCRRAYGYRPRPCVSPDPNQSFTFITVCLYLYHRPFLIFCLQGTLPSRESLLQSIS